MHDFSSGTVESWYLECDSGRNGCHLAYVSICSEFLYQQFNLNCTVTYYRPQTKFAKVVFLQVCLSTGGGVAHMPTRYACPLGTHAPYGDTCPPPRHAQPLGMHALPPLGTHVPPPLGMHTPGACTHPLGMHPPPPADTMRCGQWAGGTHPTGMHSCLLCIASPILWYKVAGSYYNGKDILWLSYFWAPSLSAPPQWKFLVNNLDFRFGQYGLPFLL